MAWKIFFERCRSVPSTVNIPLIILQYTAAILRYVGIVPTEEK